LKYKVILVTSGQPALNPRLVKEADAFSEAGHEVIVFFSYWNKYGMIFTEKLIQSKKWKAVCVGGDPSNKKLIYFFSRLINYIARKIVEKIGPVNYLSELAISRSSFFLLRMIRKHKADIYIAHNLGALAPVVQAAKRNHGKCGFDAEDFHRNEVNDDTNDIHFRLVAEIENKYLRQLDYMTASSPFIAEMYEEFFNRKITSILNVFPKTKIQLSVPNESLPIKLFWFSQTIGPNRGIETIIDAINISGINMHFHLLGNISDSYKKDLYKIAKDIFCNLHFYELVYPDDLFSIAPFFDLGLASEPGFCLNNKIALSNKLFTYIQCGCAVVASNTIAQISFLEKYPQVGRVYKNSRELADIFTHYHYNRSDLHQTKQKCIELGQKGMNWDIEKVKLLKILQATLDTSV
jgi:hypothetical protein